MKYLVLVLLFINNIIIVGQIKDSSSNDNAYKLKERSLELYYGLMPNSTKSNIFGVAYMYSINDELVHSFGLWAFKLEKGDPNLYPMLSSSLRYYYYKKQNLRTYVQGGLGTSIIVPPTLFVDFGISYSFGFISIRTFTRGNWPLYISVGIKL